MPEKKSPFFEHAPRPAQALRGSAAHSLPCARLNPTLHSYRATLWPVDLPASEVEAHAAARALPQLRVRAPNACLAAQAAARLSGQRVLEVERLEGACPASGPASASSSVAALAAQREAV